MSDSDPKTPQIRQPDVEVIGEPQGRAVVTAISLEAHAGPLPHPATFAAYEMTLPGAADRILRMAEQNQQMQHDGLKAAISHDRRQQWIVAVVGGGIFLLTFLIIILNRDPRAYWALVSEFAGLAGLAYIGKKKKEEAKN